MQKLLITRHSQKARRLALHLEENGFESFCEPLFEVEKLPVADFSGQKVSAIIITSANAAESVIESRISKSVKILAVGKFTAEKLLEAGFENIIYPPQNSAESLLEMARKEQGLILYFRGSDITIDFAKELQNVREVLCYKTHEIPNFSEELLDFAKKEKFSKVLIFSQNSARIFLRLAAKHNLLEYFGSAQILCLSEKILLDVQKAGFKNSATFDQFPILKNFYDSAGSSTGKS